MVGYRMNETNEKARSGKRAKRTKEEERVSFTAVLLRQAVDSLLQMLVDHPYP